MMDEPNSTDGVAFVTPFIRRSGKGKSFYSYKEDLLCFEAADQNSRIHLHEATHFFVHSSTPYGAFLDELSSCQHELAARFLNQIDGEVFVPVLAWVDQWRHKGGGSLSVHYPPNFDTLVGTCIEPWELLDNLEAILTAVAIQPGSAITEKMAVEQLIKCEQLLHTVAGSLEVGRTVPNLPGQEAGPAVPEVGWEWEPTERPVTAPVGSLHMDEAIAQLQEGMGVSLWERRYIDYCVAFGITVMKYGLKAISEVPKGNRRLPATCLALADLSFFTPIGLLYSQFRTPTMAWTDLHPGYRFLKALDVVAQENAWIDSLDEMGELGRMVCDQLKWVPPKTFLNLRAEEGSERHRMACSLRRAHFPCFYQFSEEHPDAGEIASLLVRRGPIICQPALPTILPSLEDDDNLAKARRLRDFYLRRFTLSAVCDPRHLDRLLPPRILYEPLRMEDVCDNRTFAAVIQERYPWASSHRLRLVRE